eukprot:GEMP01018285.1.p1 GENE.GEMP01018285.1~~GEMP01018285.1.p1  ORF type:complete len:528 (+),score=77.78 GEMP01018285.1:26-1609(+)
MEFLGDIDAHVISFLDLKTLGRLAAVSRNQYLRIQEVFHVLTVELFPKHVRINLLASLPSPNTAKRIYADHKGRKRPSTDAEIGGITSKFQCLYEAQRFDFASWGEIGLEGFPIVNEGGHFATVLTDCDHIVVWNRAEQPEARSLSSWSTDVTSLRKCLLDGSQRPILKFVKNVDTGQVPPSTSRGQAFIVLEVDGNWFDKTPQVIVCGGKITRGRGFRRGWSIAYVRCGEVFWETFPTGPSARCFAAGVYVPEALASTEFPRGYVFLCGGKSDNDADAVDVLDLDTMRWHELPIHALVNNHLLGSRFGHSCVLRGGNIVILGGEGSARAHGKGPRFRVEIDTRSVTKAGIVHTKALPFESPLPFGGFGHTVIAAQGAQVLCFGGGHHGAMIAVCNLDGTEIRGVAKSDFLPSRSKALAYTKSTNFGSWRGGYMQERQLDDALGHAPEDSAHHAACSLFSIGIPLIFLVGGTNSNNSNGAWVCAPIRTAPRWMFDRENNFRNRQRTYGEVEHVVKGARAEMILNEMY